MNSRSLALVRTLSRLLALSLATAAFAAAGPPAPPESAPPSPPPAGVLRVDALGITVADLDASVRFYTDVLQFREVARREESGDAIERLTGVFGARCLTARLALGEESIELTQFLAPEGRPVPPDSRSNDRWFQHAAIVVADMDRAYAHLRSHKVRHASSGPQTLPAWNVNAAGISAFYFKDPDAHVLEIIHFPRGKGDPRWQAPSDRLFLGIDHTAIVVADTERSLAFYRDTLGLTVAGGSENYGPEQERLNNVFGARLRITTLRAASGPGVELLEYLAPTTGRDAPRDLHANDLLHWHTILITPRPDAAAAALRLAHAAWVSPGLITDLSPPGTARRAAQVLDPDRHAVILDEDPAPSAAVIQR